MVVYYLDSYHRSIPHLSRSRHAVSLLSVKPERALTQRERNSGDHMETGAEDGPGGGSTVIGGRWSVVEGTNKLDPQEMD